jgi:hypothetical protein
MDIFNPLAKAMLQSYQMAMSKGMPPEQAEAYVNSITRDEVKSAANLPGMLRTFNQLKQPQTQPLQTPNIYQQVMGMARMPQQGLSAIAPQMMAQMPPQVPPQMMAQMQSQVPAMQRGIGGMNAGRMENPRGFNRGGIIAFSNGDVVQGANTPPIVAANLPKPRSTEDMYAYYADLFGQGVVPTYKEEEKTLSDIYKERGIGEFAKSFEEEKELLETQEKRSLEELLADKENLTRQEAADIAGASVGSRSLLEAMAKSRSAAVTRERDLEKEIRKARADREKAGLDITKAQEQARKATTDKAFERASGRIDKAQERMVKAEETINQNRQRMREIKAETEGRLAEARISNEARENLTRIQGAIEMGLIQRRAELEKNVKNNTASPEDRLGLQLLNAIDAHRAKPTDETKKVMDDLFNDYERFRRAASRPSTGGSGNVDVTTVAGAQTGKTPAGTEYFQVD